MKSENATNHVDSLDMEFILNDGPSKQQDDERNKELEILNDETLSHQVYDDSVTISDSSEIDIRIAELTEKSNGCYTCRVCGKTATKYQNISNHVETHLEGVSHSCQQCGKSYRSRNSLKNHKSVYHR